MLVLGLNAFHADSSAALLRDGKLIAAAEEERFRRLKHWAGFPTRAIAYCLSEAGVQLSDVDHVAFNQDSRAHLLKKMRYVLTKRPDVNLIINRLRNRRARAGILDLLEAAFPGQCLQRQASSQSNIIWRICLRRFIVSPFREAAVVSIDGFGDFSSAAWGIGCDGQISIYETGVYFPHSLGIFYQALTQYLGFPHYGDEYKVMGLAPTASRRISPEMRKIVRLLTGRRFELESQYFRHHKREDCLPMDRRHPAMWATLFSPALEELLGPAAEPDDPLERPPPRYRPLGAGDVRGSVFPSAQHACKSDHRLDRSCPGRRLRDEFGSQWQGPPMYARSDAFTSSGGWRCGALSVRRLHVWHQTLGGRRASFVMDHAYLGPCVH